MKSERNEPLSQGTLKRALSRLGKKDPEIRRAVAALGVPNYRRNPLNFRNLLRIIVGQQLTGKAASTIFGRVEAAVAGNLTPAAILSLSDATLRGCGLSRQKVVSCRSLASALDAGEVRLRQLHTLDNETVEANLTTVKGFGPWSAHMALLFLLGRRDVWPTGDLGVRVGVQRLLQLSERPDAATLEKLGERWRPCRSAIALLAWRAANEKL